MQAHTDTLVLDIGKSNAKLALIDPRGDVLRSLRTANQSVPDAAHGFMALGTERLAAWLRQGVPELVQGRAPRRIAITTHGAAFCALGDDGLVLPPIDYEWDGYGDATAAFDASLDDFAHHGTPRLPQGLNGGRQIAFVEGRWPALAARIRCWLPYAQYWAWWFSGVACSELSSLGCHTGLWSPGEGRFSDWAIASGVAQRFAPVRRAWDVIGCLRPALATAWGLPEGVEVIAGAHDSNACLARYLGAHPHATVVSTGTWCVAMAPGADTARLMPERDQLVNVAVDGRAVATARFMGGREFAVLCDAADPELATAEALADVLREGWMALPAFAPGGGPFAGQQGNVLRHGEPASGGIATVPPRLRPALAALYCANVSALLVSDLAHRDAVAAASSPVIMEGPLAHSAAYRLAMASAVAPRPLWRSIDPLEGTARGAWMLAHWDDSNTRSQGALLQPAFAPNDALGQALRAHARGWGMRAGDAVQSEQPRCV
jgi:sugar (pentulose or hexulose) kinase